MKKVNIIEVGEDTETKGYYVRFHLPDGDPSASISGLAYLSEKYVWTHIAGGTPHNSQIAAHVESFVIENYNAISSRLVNDPYLFFVNNPTIDRQSVRARLIP